MLLRLPFAIIFVIKLFLISRIMREKYFALCEMNRSWSNFFSLGYEHDHDNTAEIFASDLY